VSTIATDPETRKKRLVSSGLNQYRGFISMGAITCACN
jgi:hypothetical protein